MNLFILNVRLLRAWHIDGLVGRIVSLVKWLPFAPLSVYKEKQPFCSFTFTDVCRHYLSSGQQVRVHRPVNR